MADSYVQTQVTQAGGCCFDPAFALRTCKDVSVSACVLLYDAMDMAEEAVAAALAGGLTQAAHRVAAERGTRDVERVGVASCMLLFMDTNLLSPRISGQAPVAPDCQGRQRPNRSPPSP